jgi:nicotinate-nucleotide adenylyltransferase
MNKKHKIGLFGGALNPITKGHIEVCQFVLNNSDIEYIWLVPCYNHMFGKDMASPEQRLEMCKLACQVDGRIKVCDYEIKNKLRGETYHLLRRLLDEQFAKDEYDFSFIIGMDNANNFHTWVNYEHLERLIRFVVVPRSGVARNESVNWYLNPPHIYLGSPDKPFMDVSSTMVREAIRANTSIDQWVDKNVVKYITENNLYK